MRARTASLFLQRLIVNPKIFSGKPIIRGRRLAVAHVLRMPAAGDTAQTLLEGYPWLKPEDIQACLRYARNCGIVFCAIGYLALNESEHQHAGHRYR